MKNLYNLKPLSHLFVIICLLIFGSQSQSLARAKVEGFVTDSKTKKPIVGASVYVRDIKKGVTTDDKGYYMIYVPFGDYTIAASSVTHRLKVRTLNINDDVRIDFDLDESAHDLDEVIITGKTMESNVKDVDMGVVKLNIQNLRKIPVVFGEADILKALMLQSGVSTVGEGAGGFNVRGGRVDQNLVLVDEIPIFNTSHLLGFFTNINPDVVQDVTLYKGGIPASYGGRLSSLLNVNTKNGNNEKVNFQWGIGPVSARVLAEGPIIKDKLTFLVGARGAYPNWIIKNFPDKYASSRASFYDANLKLQYKFNQNNRLSVSLYRSFDNFKFDEDTLYSWHSTAASATFSSAISKKLFLNISGVYSFYEFGLEGLQQTLEYKISNSILQKEAKMGLIYNPNDRHKIEIGGNYINYGLNPAFQRPIGDNSSVNTIQLEKEQANEMAAYISEEFIVSPKITVSAGLRYSMFEYLGSHTVRSFEEGVPKSVQSISSQRMAAEGEKIATYGGLEPRLALKIGVGELNSVKLSYNRTRQYLHLISNTTAISPVDFWKLSDNHITPQLADQVAMGVFRNFEDNTYETSVEGYYKDIPQMIEYKNGATLLLNPNIETDLLSAKGKSYGVEFNVKKNKGKFTGMASYTYSRTFVQVVTPFPIELVNGGNWYPSVYDRPHVTNLSGSLQIGKGWTVSGNFTYQTGRPTTYPDGQFSFNNTLVNNFSKRNEDRLPSYNRLDFSISKDTRKVKTQKRYSTWNFSLYNFYARRNPYSIYFTRQNLGTTSYRLSVLGTIIPSLTLNFYY